MKTLKKILVTFIILIAAGNVWGIEPKDFRGVPFDASLAQAREKLPYLRCPSMQDYKGIWFDNETVIRRAEQLEVVICNEDDSYIGPVNINIMYTFRHNKMVTVYISFKSSDYNYLKDVYIKKYGKPLSTKTNIIQTEMSVKYVNESIQWGGKNVLIELEKYAGTIGSGSIFYITTKELSRINKESEESKEKAIKDI